MHTINTINIHTESVLQTMNNGPCIAAHSFAKSLLWNKLSISQVFLEWAIDYHRLYQEICNIFEDKKHAFIYFPCPILTKSLHESNDILHQYYVPIMDSLLLQDKDPHIGNPFSPDYYYMLNNKEIFSLLLTKTSNRNGRKLNNHEYFCIVLQTRDQFGEGVWKDKLTQKIRSHIKNTHSCPFHSLLSRIPSKKHLYPEEMTHFASHSIEWSVSNFLAWWKRMIYTSLPWTWYLSHFNPNLITLPNKMHLNKYSKILPLLESLEFSKFKNIYSPSSPNWNIIDPDIFFNWCLEFTT